MGEYIKGYPFSALRSRNLSGAFKAETCYNGVQSYFCAPGCKAAFDANPEKYAAKRRKAFWRRYLDRLNKATGGQPPACH